MNGKPWKFRPEKAAAGTIAYAHMRGVLTMLREIAYERGTTVTEMLARSRKPIVVHARWEAARRIKIDKGYSWNEIGKILGIDHTSIIYGVRKLEEQNERGTIV